MTRPSNHWNWRLPAMTLALLGLAPAAHAIDAIVLEVRELTMAGIPVTGANVRLDVLTDKQTRLTVTARTATLADPVGKLADVTLRCDAPIVAEPRYGCDAGRLTARGGPSGAIDMKVAAEMNTVSGVTTFRGSGLKVAGTSAVFNGELDSKGWWVKAKTDVTKISALRKFAQPWFEIPKDLTVEGNVALEGTLTDTGKGTVADVTMRLDGAEFTNEAGDIVGEKLKATLHVNAQPRAADTALTFDIEATQGQSFLSVIFLDFAKNPLTLDARGLLKESVLNLDSLHFVQRDVIDLNGSGQLNLAADIPAFSGDLTLAKLQFPDAYATYLANVLASSLLGDLRTEGSLSGEISLHDNGVTALHLIPKDLELHDNKGRLFLSKVNGEVSWSPDGAERASRLTWAAGGAYGLSGGAATLDFIASGMNFRLTRPTKLPVLDGAIDIETFVMGNLGADNMEVAFKGKVEPISMQLLAKGFGWPEFSGKLAATIPGVTLKDNVLRFDGNVESEVFGGRIVGSNIRLQDPLGNFPQLFADVRARDLDLGLVTNTFEVGSITGRLEADVLGLQLFGWSPVAFDARLATPQGDKSRHRISAKAVSSLSNVGGGGGGVVQALQSGVLRFFDEYSYDRLGITCKLRDDVCEMSGIEPAGVGYYIVKGAGIPRIDIVGNSGRVRWSQLLATIPRDVSNVTVK